MGPVVDCSRVHVLKIIYNIYIYIIYTRFCTYLFSESKSVSRIRVIIC